MDEPNSRKWPKKLDILIYDHMRNQLNLIKQSKSNGQRPYYRPDFGPANSFSGNLIILVARHDHRMGG